MGGRAAEGLCILKMVLSWPLSSILLLKFRNYQNRRNLRICMLDIWNMTELLTPPFYLLTFLYRKNRENMQVHWKMVLSNGT